MDKIIFKESANAIIKLIDLLGERPKFYTDRNSANTNINVLEKEMKRINFKRFKEYRRIKEMVGRVILSRVNYVLRYQKFARETKDDVDLLIKPYIIDYVWRYLFKYKNGKSNPETFLNRLIGQSLSKARSYSRKNMLEELLPSMGTVDKNVDESIDTNTSMDKALERLVNLYSGKL